MGNVRIKVFEADGRHRGGFHRDDVAAPHRWIGRTQANLSEVMVCDGDPSTGSWLLMEYVLPRHIEGAEADNSQVDTGSRCCERTVPQALLWFTGQDFGPPPALVQRARRFASDWSEFRSSAHAIAILEQLCQQKFTPCEHPAFQGDGKKMLQLFEKIDLLGLSRGTPPCLFVVSLVADVGVRQFIDWMDSHVNAIAALLAIPPMDPAAAASSVKTPITSAEWYLLAEAVERAYDLMGSYSGLLSHVDPANSNSDLEWSIWQLEVVMRRWYPLADPADDPLVNSVHGLIGKRKEAKETIDASDRLVGRQQCLKSIAERAHPQALPPQSLVASCREDLRIWRSLLPDRWASGVGPMKLTRDQRSLLHAPALYWSVDSTRRCSWEGAAYLLAAGCERLSKLATSLGLPTERVRPTLRLALRLREFPQWSSIDDSEIDKFVREQIDLARDFEELAAEVSLLLVPEERVAESELGLGPDLGSGGPAKTFDAVLRALLEKHSCAKFVADLEVDREAVKRHLQGQDAKKAADYLSPGGRLVRGGWIRRRDTAVILTELGARQANHRLTRGVENESAS